MRERPLLFALFYAALSMAALYPFSRTFADSPAAAQPAAALLPQAETKTETEKASNRAENSLNFANIDNFVKRAETAKPAAPPPAKDGQADCLSPRDCAAKQTADEDSKISLDFSFDDEGDEKRADGGIPAKNTENSIGLQQNLDKNWQAGSALTFSGKSRGGRAFIGYKW